MHDYDDYKKRRRQRKSYQEILDLPKDHPRIFLLILAIIAAALLFSGCDVVNSGLNRGKVIVPLLSQDNCTPAEVYTADGEYLKTIPAHGFGEVEVDVDLFDPQDETYLVFQTPKSMIDQILAGNPNVIPRGCDDWGYGNERIRLPDGYETDPKEIRLDPPDYWDEPSKYNTMPGFIQEQIDRFKKRKIFLK